MIFARVQTGLLFVLRLNTILGFQYRASTQLRLQTFKIRLENETRVGTPICRNLKIIHSIFRLIPGECLTSKRRPKHVTTSTKPFTIYSPRFKQRKRIRSELLQTKEKSQREKLSVVFYRWGRAQRWSCGVVFYR